MKKRALCLLLCLVLLVPTAVRAENAQYISHVGVTIDVPVHGAKPAYTVTCDDAAGELYHVLDASGDGFINGIYWYDYDECKKLNASSTFIGGHRYVIKVRLEQTTEVDFRKDLQGKINGYDAEVTATKDLENDYVTLAYAFDCPVVPISSISIKITPPAEDKTPSFTASVDATNYTVQSIDWLQVSPDDTEKIEKAIATNDHFERGKTYVASIHLEAVEGYVFDESFDASSVLLNGVTPDFFDKQSQTSIYIRQVYALRAITGTIPFFDVKESDYFYRAVVWAYNAEPQITTGIDARYFGPSGSVTRGQAVTFLWRAKGCPEPKSAANPFSDINPSDYYYKAILWAVENGITNGTDATHFSPGQICSTAHIITFLYRTMGAGENGWYEIAEAWAEESGLLDGLNITVSPFTDCPRRDVVLFLYRQLAG
ncbi:MAG: S-layer homology domain-containing protein [Ruminococcaceae bacterium]|nr:S-layer homology domain-containing protein [Oscillospiraceae bacterium]